MNQIAEKIDFSRMGGPVFSGRAKGQINRKNYNLDEKDQSDAIIEVDIPDNAYAVTSSFFLGLFGESIRSLGGRNQFRAKYNIKAPERFNEKIEFYIERAIREKSPVLEGR